MQYRIATADDVRTMLPADVDKSHYNPDQVDLVYMVDADSGTIKYGRAVDHYLSAYQMFNVVILDDGAELVPSGPWKPLVEGADITPQARRQLAVMSLLDINLDQWVAWLERDLEAEAHLGIQVGDLVAQMIHALQNLGHPGQDKLYLQAIAMLSDEGLVKVIERVTGKAPY